MVNSGKKAFFLALSAIWATVSGAKESKLGEQTRRKRVLITGCSSGFGLAIAVEAAKAGYECIATMRNLAKADYLKKMLESENANAIIDQLGNR